MKELCKLAEEKGFRCKTFSTRWTMDHHLERGKAKFMVNKECNVILLAEIQYWLRETHKLSIELCSETSNDFLDNSTYWSVGVYCLKSALPVDNIEDIFNESELALEKGLIEGLKLIECQNIES